MTYQITPLGGFGEIGANMVAFESKDAGFIIDCGLLFPYEEAFDINYLIPSFDHLDPKKFLTLVITHAHEDHIGAIVHVVKWNPRIVIYASSFAQNLILRRLKEVQLSVKMQDLNHLDQITIGESQSEWVIRPISVNHSIPQPFGILVTSSYLNIAIYYCSDFKSFPENVNREDSLLLKKLMAPFKRRLALIDSTNILNDRATGQEEDLLPELENVIQTPGCLLFTLFTSNIERLNTLFRLAKKHDRQIVAMGRSVHNSLLAAIEVGIAHFAETDYIDADSIEHFSRERLLFIVAGCQGDFLSALRRVSYGEDTKVKLGPGDRVVFSSRVIPGNEDKITRMYNKITLQGAEVITADDKLIHCSGHPGKPDIIKLINHNDFTDYIPVHGESLFLKRHEQFVNKHYPNIKTYLVNNGQKITLKPEQITIDANEFWKEPIIIHGKGIELERSQVSQRRKIAAMGSMYLSVFNKDQHWILDFYGLPLNLELQKTIWIDKLKDLLEFEMKGKSTADKAEFLRIKLRQLAGMELGYRPLSFVHFM